MSVWGVCVLVAGARVCVCVWPWVSVWGVCAGAGDLVRVCLCLCASEVVCVYTSLGQKALSSFQR